MGTEEDQEVTGEGDPLVVSPTEDHLAPSGGHQLEGGLQHQHVKLVSLAGIEAAGHTGNTGGHSTRGLDRQQQTEG